MERLCEVIEVARSSFYAWLAPPLRGRRESGPDRYRYGIALTIVRTSENFRPGRPVGAGNKPSFNDH